MTTDLSSLCCPGQAVPASCSAVTGSAVTLLVTQGCTCCTPSAASPRGLGPCLSPCPPVSAVGTSGLTVWLWCE